MIKNSTIAIIQKRYALSLINEGYKLLNIAPSKKRPGKFVYVFERTDELLNAFDELIKKYHAGKVVNRLTQRDIRSLIGLLQGYAIEEEDTEVLESRLISMDDDYDAKYKRDCMINKEGNE